MITLRGNSLTGRTDDAHIQKSFVYDEDNGMVYATGGGAGGTAGPGIDLDTVAAMPLGALRVSSATNAATVTTSRANAFFSNPTQTQNVWWAEGGGNNQFILHLGNQDADDVYNPTAGSVLAAATSSTTVDPLNVNENQRVYGADGSIWTINQLTNLGRFADNMDFRLNNAYRVRNAGATGPTNINNSTLRTYTLVEQDNDVRQNSAAQVLADFTAAFGLNGTNAPGGMIYSGYQAASISYTPTGTAFDTWSKDGLNIGSMEFDATSSQATFSTTGRSGMNRATQLEGLLNETVEMIAINATTGAELARLMGTVSDVRIPGGVTTFRAISFTSITGDSLNTFAGFGVPDGSIVTIGTAGAGGGSQTYTVETSARGTLVESSRAIARGDFVEI